MKIERTITLTLEETKECCEKDGELREVTLQSFSEEKLNPNIKYIDLGLPSGTLWADSNEEGYYSYDEAINTFGKNNLPKLSDYAELYDYCKWKWNREKKVMVVTGPNGNCIIFSALGCRYSSSGKEYSVGNLGYYWSVTPHIDNKAYCLCFYNNSKYIYPSNYNNCTYNYTVRKIKRK